MATNKIITIDVTKSGDEKKPIDAILCTNTDWYSKRLSGLIFLRLSSVPSCEIPMNERTADSGIEFDIPDIVSLLTSDAELVDDRAPGYYELKSKVVVGRWVFFR